MYTFPHTWWKCTPNIDENQWETIKGEEEGLVNKQIVVVVFFKFKSSIELKNKKKKFRLQKLFH